MSTWPGAGSVSHTQTKGRTGGQRWVQTCVIGGLLSGTPKVSQLANSLRERVTPERA
jgi:hypothetical protein